MLVTDFHFQSSLMFTGKIRSLPLSPIRGSTMVSSNVNIRLGWKLKAVQNILAYHNTATITAVNSFIVQAPGVSIRYSPMVGSKLN